MSKVIDLTGLVFNRLLVLSEVTPRSSPIKWLCQCECGNTKMILGASLKNGLTKSCGCLHLEKNKEMFTKHGEYKTKLFAIHQAMLRRCTTPTHKNYHLYGGRGITVCVDWQDYVVFKKWAENSGYMEGLTLDRKNNNGNYEPENCRWATRITQSRNRNVQQGFSSQYIGVHWDINRSKWFASIGVNGKHIALGRFTEEIAAAKARDAYIALQGLKDFVLNFN